MLYSLRSSAGSNTPINALTFLTVASYCLVFGLGAAVGSFLNVVIYRVPRGRSLLYPPSRCPICLTTLKPWDNIPILGWLFLRGQCRYCHAPIAWRYPAIELLTALLYVLIVAVSGWQEQTLVLWLLSAWLLALALIDLETMTLPHPLTKWGLITGLVVRGLTTGLGGLTEGIIAAVIGIWLFDLIRWGGAIALNQEVMGGGDGKLAAMIGAWLGWQGLLVTFFLASALGGLMGGFGIALGWIQRRQPIPFGPFLAVAAIFSGLFGRQLIHLYLETFLRGVFVP
ncbi:MAG: type 4 prepilin-like proteins leader peptide-processing enzyme [Thermosynechococcus sp.]|uniref:prepilin peptidase n=1 Tax=Thermosynechococcus sp. TaxID=2814275 RepID=UPI0021FCCBFB|nr:MAG: type 4 prepilin-like proteins leader peptide-processing enzyme [Thermosynechococcus sp.]